MGAEKTGEGPTDRRQWSPRHVPLLKSSFEEGQVPLGPTFAHRWRITLTQDQQIARTPCPKTVGGEGHRGLALFLWRPFFFG